tara:strand:+ start:137 stop:502 length:366 start_codon:yes stop_codon:yes gene_type:complete
MKHIIFCALIIWCSSTYGQTPKEYNSLLKSYTSQELNELKEKRPDHYELLSYALNNAVYFGSYDASKHNELPKIQGLNESKNFSDYGLKIEDINQYFYCPEINKVMVVKSFWVLKHEKEKS